MSKVLDLKEVLIFIEDMWLQMMVLDMQSVSLLSKMMFNQVNTKVYCSTELEKIFSQMVKSPGRNLKMERKKAMDNIPMQMETQSMVSGKMES